MLSEKPIPQDYTTKNQEHYRKARRGIFSRPIELPRTGRALHERVIKTFGLENAEEPILTWSVFFDAPKTPSSEFVFAERYPEEVKEDDRQNFSIGISRINEYATNYASKEFFRRNADLPVVRQIASVYGEASDLLTYGIFLNGTFSRMRDLELMARHHKKDYKQAILDGLFKHDFTKLNELIAMTKDYTGYSDINGLAIEIGKKRLKKPDIGKWLDKLDAKRTDGRVKSAVKNGVLSTAALGVFRNPGVIETSGAIIPASPLIAGIGTFVAVESIILTNRIDLILHPEHMGLFLNDIVSTSAASMAAIMGLALGLTPFVGVHEAIHHYSSNEEYMGFIPTRIIKKSVTPYKSRLEIEE